MKDKNRTMIPQYFVTADPDTGEWLTTPEYVQEVDKAQWDALTDTHATHYDTYEHHFVTAACVTGERMTAYETRAIEVRWESGLKVADPLNDLFSTGLPEKILVVGRREGYVLYENGELWKTGSSPYLAMYLLGKGEEVMDRAIDEHEEELRQCATDFFPNGATRTS